MKNQIWEYHTFNLNFLGKRPFDETALAILNDIGSKGWELVTVTNEGLYIFKRVKS